VRHLGDWWLPILAAGVLLGLAGAPVALLELAAARTKPRPGRNPLAALAAVVVASASLTLAFFAADYVDSRFQWRATTEESLEYLAQLWRWIAVRPGDYAAVVAVIAAPFAALVWARLEGFSGKAQCGISLLALALVGLAGALALDAQVLREQGGALVIGEAWDLAPCLILAPIAPFAFAIGDRVEARVEARLRGDS
jgi:hypothetical protein